MKKTWLLGLAAVGAVGAVLVARRRSGSGYDDDEIDFAGDDAEFGHRTDAPKDVSSAPAETRTDITPERLSMAARIETAYDDIRHTWPSLSLDDVRTADGDVDRLAGMIAEQAEEPREQVRQRLDAIIEKAVPDPSYPGH